MGDTGLKTLKIHYRFFKFYFSNAIFSVKDVDLQTPGDNLHE